MADFCEHCEGQRFDRAQVLRALRAVRSDLRRRHGGQAVDEALASALRAIAALELPHLRIVSPEEGDVVVH